MNAQLRDLAFLAAMALLFVLALPMLLLTGGQRSTGGRR